VGLFGMTLVWIDGTRMGRVLPHRSFALFWRKRKVSKGDIVLVDHPEHGRIVKLVAAVTINGRYSLRGKQANSTDETPLGAVDGRQIRGTLIWRITKGRALPA